MLLHLKKIDSGLIPVGYDSVNAFNKMSGDVFVEHKPRRNYKFHKKYFALLNAVIHNQTHFKTVDNLHEAVKYRGGYYETIFTLTGDKFIKTKSISFNSMSADEFEDFYSIAIDTCLELVGDDALNEILRFL